LLLHYFFYSIGIQVTQAYQDIQTITLPDTRWESVQWIKDHMHTGSHIGREHYISPIEKYTEQFHVSYLGYFAVVSNPKSILKKPRLLDSQQWRLWSFSKFCIKIPKRSTDIQ